MPGTNIVIGAGLAGLCTALALLERGEDVTILEAREGVGLGASHANGCLLHPSQPGPWNSPALKANLLPILSRRDGPIKFDWLQLPSMASWGLRFLRNATEDRYRFTSRANHDLAVYSTRLTCDLAARLFSAFPTADAATIKIFRHPFSLDHAERMARLMAEEGLVYRLLSASEAAAAEPLLVPVRDRIAGALVYKGDVIAHAGHFCLRLADEIMQAGGTVKTGQRIRQFILSGDRVTGVATADGDMWADRIFVAAGSGSTDFLKPLGIRLPIRPVRGHSLTLDLAGRDGPRGAMIDEDLQLAVTPLGDRLRIVGGAEFGTRDAGTNRAIVRSMIAAFEMLCPELARQLDLAEAEPWAGLRPMSADGRPFLGPTPIAGLHVNSGHGHLGWTCAMGSAAIVADLALGLPTAIDAAPFLANRIG